jgi:hypothetical protein
MYCFVPFYTSRANNKRFSENKKKNKKMKRQNSIFNDKWGIASILIAALVVLGFALLINPSKKVIKKYSPDIPIHRQGSGVR